MDIQEKGNRYKNNFKIDNKLCCLNYKVFKVILKQFYRKMKWLDNGYCL